MDVHFIPCYRGLAKALKCPNKAMIIQHMVWSIKDKEGKPFYEKYQRDGEYYMWNTHDEWHQLMPWLGHSTIRKHLAELKNDGWIFTCNLSETPTDRTIYYTVDMVKYTSALDIFGFTMCSDLAVPSARIEHMHLLESSSSICSNLADVLITKNHTKNHTKNIPHKKCIPFDFDIAKRWLDYNKIKSPKGKFNENKFAEAIMRMRTRISYSEQYIESLFKWMLQDHFYSKLSPSPAGLLKPSPSNPDLTKLEVMAIHYEGRKKSKSERVMDSILKNESEVEPDYNPLRLT